MELENWIIFSLRTLSIVKDIERIVLVSGLTMGLLDGVGDIWPHLFVLKEGRSTFRDD